MEFYDIIKLIIKCLGIWQYGKKESQPDILIYELLKEASIPLTYQDSDIMEYAVNEVLKEEIKFKCKKFAKIVGLSKFLRQHYGI